jgi:hypothetical protein
VESLVKLVRTPIFCGSLPLRPLHRLSHESVPSCTFVALARFFPDALDRHDSKHRLCGDGGRCWSLKSSGSGRGSGMYECRLRIIERCVCFYRAFLGMFLLYVPIAELWLRERFFTDGACVHVAIRLAWTALPAGSVFGRGIHKGPLERLKPSPSKTAGKSIIFSMVLDFLTQLLRSPIHQVPLRHYAERFLSLYHG